MYFSTYLTKKRDWKVEDIKQWGVSKWWSYLLTKKKATNQDITIDAVTQNWHMTSQMYIILCTVSHLLFLNTSTLAPQLSYSIHDVKQTKTYKDDCYNTFKKYT